MDFYFPSDNVLIKVNYFNLKNACSKNLNGKKTKKDTRVKLFPTRLPVEIYPLLRASYMSFQNWRSQGSKDELDGAEGEETGDNVG